jgi:hypothetical protein
MVTAALSNRSEHRPDTLFDSPVVLFNEACPVGFDRMDGRPGQVAIDCRQIRLPPERWPERKHHETSEVHRGPTTGRRRLQAALLHPDFCCPIIRGERPRLEIRMPPRAIFRN